MADSQQEIDWSATRQTALKCLGAALDLVSFSERAKAGYDAALAAMHLRAIRNACETLVDAVRCMGRWHFDCLALASVGEGPRPDFHFGKVSCATAHETAFRLLHAADTKLMEQLRAALRETGLDAKVNVNNLERLSPQDLRKTLIRAARSGPLISLDPQGLHLVKSWIDREWAAVSHSLPKPPPDVDPNDDPNIPDPDETLVRKLRGYQRPILLYLWKRGNVTRDQLRKAVWKEKKISDKGIDKAVERLNTRLYELNHTLTSIESNGGMHYLKHPQK